MPRKAQTPNEKTRRRIAKAKTKAAAKARERKAKAEGVTLDYDDTVHANAGKRYGFRPEQWQWFLRIFGERFKGSALSLPLGADDEGPMHDSLETNEATKSKRKSAKK